MTLTCACGTVNRIPSLPKGRIQCGKCRHMFTPMELVKAKHEPPPERKGIFELEREDDIPFDPDEDEDWEGDQE